MSGHPEADIYHRQGMGNRAGLGQAPALVIVDFVAGFADPAHFGGGNIGPAIAQTVHLLAFARRHGWPGLAPPHLHGFIAAMSWMREG